MAHFQGIRAADLVTYTTPQGQIGQGRAQALLCFADHVVVNIGGAHGTPVVVNASNYVRHKPRRRLPGHTRHPIASRAVQQARYLDCGPQAWDDRDSESGDY